MTRPTIAIDLDGTLIHHGEWKGVDHFGEPLPGAVEFTKELAKVADIVIHTCRTNPELNPPEAAFLLANRVRRFLDEKGFAYHNVWCGEGKVIANVYLDDRAVHAGLNVGYGDEWRRAHLLKEINAVLTRSDHSQDYSKTAEKVQS